MSISFSVLTPTGRRQIVKVTPNSTILQVLEEVCQKQKLDSSEFDLRHHSRILDASSVVRFSQLPNNAQLELVTAKKKREESLVNIMLQLEDGTRLNGDFLPNCTLKDVIFKLNPTGMNSVVNPTIIYMRKEIIGIDELSTTTLKDLGLTSGRALLRFLNRSKEQLSHQQNVSNPLVKPAKVENQLPKATIMSEAMDSKPTTSRTVNEPSENPEIATESMDCETTPSTSSNSLDQSNDWKGSENRQALKRVLGEEIKNGSDKMDCNANACDSVPIEKKPCKSYEIEEPAPAIDVSKVEFLGEREALLFNVSDHKTSRLADDTLPEEFFDLTLEDARSLMRDYKRVREDLENAVLSTQAMKDLSNSRRVLAHLNKYQQTVVRIQFPDRFVLQGVFKPLETVQNVIDFVTEYIRHPTASFYLYTVPPKTVLDPSQTLVEADCVPAAVVYFGSSEQSNLYLKEKYILRTVEPNVASYFANKSRKFVKKDGNNGETANLSQNNVKMECLPGPSHASDNENSGVASRYTSQSAKSNSNVPKWFKPV